MLTRIYIFVGSRVVWWFNRHELDVVPLLRWKTAYPSKPGWYWVRAPHISPRIEKFYEATHGMQSQDHYVSWLHGKPREFAGPVEAPPET